ncbi:MAG: hypothetical protein WA681_04475, partial [Candidatus Acidiferrales bacterium]
KALIALSSILFLLAIVGGYVVIDGVLQAGILERAGLVALAIVALVFLLRGYNHYREDSLFAKSA